MIQELHCLSGDSKKLIIFDIVVKRGEISMPTSSFDKEFKLETQKEVDSFFKILDTPCKSTRIKSELLSRETQGEEKIRKMLSDQTVKNKQK